MIQCTKEGPRCRKKAVAYILLKGAVGIGQEAAVVPCCIEHANQMLYGKTWLESSGLTLGDAFIQGYGVLSENYRVLFITDEMHRGEEQL